MKRSRISHCSALIALAAVCFVPAAKAVVIDGIVSPGEYANMAFVPFIDGGQIVSDRGEIYWEVDANGDLNVAFITPRFINDNSYGDSEKFIPTPTNPELGPYSVGWANKSNDHKFGNLTGSDKGVFEIDTGNGTTFEVEVDYISKDPNAVSGYASLGLGGDGGIKGTSAANFLGAASSLGYNLNVLFPTQTQFTTKTNGVDPHSPEAMGAPLVINGVVQTDKNGNILVDYSQPYTVTDPAFQGWVFEMIYEFKISANAFANTGGFAGVRFVDSHNSPAKSGAQVVVIPEPASSLAGALLLFGAFGREFGRERRRRQR